MKNQKCYCLMTDYDEGKGEAKSEEERESERKTEWDELLFPCFPVPSCYRIIECVVFSSSLERMLAASSPDSTRHVQFM